MSKKSTNYRYHKRHKSSLSSIGYYFPSDQQQTQPQSQSSPIQLSIENTNLYDNYPYSINYNFPSKGQQSEINNPNTSITNNETNESHNDDTAIDRNSIRNPSAKQTNMNQPPVPSFFHYPSQLQTSIYESVGPSSSASNSYPPASNYQIASSSSYPPPIASSSSQITYPPSIENSNLYTFTYPKLPEYSSATIPTTENSSFKQHQKNNLSISSHFNLFNLNEDQPKRVPTAAVPNSITNELLINLIGVDGSNINDYLLSILYKLNLPVPVDDFYNLLYNNDKLESLVRLNIQQKIDKTLVTANNRQPIQIINQLLNVFKNPNHLIDYFPNLVDKENKLLNINYHELLRTFLAIKILSDILIQLPLNANDEPQNYTIPRLSIYKTYYIICQKLILKYPSSSNTTNEQQKLILGQSKLGKLIKLVYPNLLIKRLGSRGESKYNYLGVVWNENIVNDEIKRLCSNNELIDLNDIFNGKQKLQRNLSISSTSSASKSKHKKSISMQKLIKEEKDEESNIISTPNLSFVKPFLKYPIGEEFTILNNKSWFSEIKSKIYTNNSSLIPSNLIDDILLNNADLTENDNLLNNLVTKIIEPIIKSENTDNKIDLNLYLIIIIEVLPYLLLVKSSTNINFLKNLRSNLLHLINNLNTELNKLNQSNRFNINNSTIFLITLKKLININDLLITFIKLIMKDNSKSIMSSDIENFLKINFNNNDTSTEIEDEDYFHEPSQILDFNFKNDILSNDLIYTLIGYNFDPTVNSELKSSLSINFINQEINIIDEFFKKDLLDFLNNNTDNDNEATSSYLSSTYSSNNSSTESDENLNENSSILSSKELNKLTSLITLIDKKLLSSHFTSKYPILMLNNFISLILNDILKFIFLKQQQVQLQSQSTNSNINQQNTNQNSFGNWWVFNSFIQEYLSLLGEIVGLNELL